MKTSTILLASALTIFSSGVFANAVSFTKQADDLETEACYTAATQGLASAKSFLRDSNINYTEFRSSVMCNGMSITQFAKKYFNSADNDAQSIEVVAISALDQNPESLLCVDAVTMGEKAARAKHGIKLGSVLCNGKEIGRFLKDFENRKVVKTDSTDNTIASL